MDKIKRNLIILVVVFFLVIISAAICIQSTNSSENVKNTHIITDMAGKEVEIPTEIKSAVITCCGGASHEFAVLGASDLVKAHPKKCISDNLLKIIQSYGDLSDVGSFNNINLEEILSLNPDVVVASVTSGEGNEMIENAGIPVIRVLTGKATLEKLPKEFEMMGEVLGQEQEAARLVSYWNEKLKMVEDRISDIPESERKSVYYMLGNTLHTNGGDWWGQDFITAAGGINVAENLTNTRDINLEELFNWNPEVIIISSNEGTYIPVEDVMSNSQLSDIKAVLDNELYECPIGTFWWDRPSPETPLGIMWLAKTLYPEEFEDISIVDETRSFYSEFYNYNLTDDEIEDILNPDTCQSCRN